MPYKACVYKGCDNYTYNCIPCGNKPFTIFRFPKDPIRYEQWMELGQVPDSLPETRMLMCSEHFDKKYLMKNFRRTLLTNTAVPFPYCDTSNDLEDDNNFVKDCADSIEKVADTPDTEMVFSIQGDLNDDSAFIRLKENICNDDEGNDGYGVLEYIKDGNNSNAEYCVESTTMKESEVELADIDGEYAEVSDFEEEQLLTDIIAQSVDLFGDSQQQPTQSVENDNNSKSNAAKKRKIHSDTDEEPSSSKLNATKITTLNENKSVNVKKVSKRNIRQENAAENDENLRQQNKKQDAQQMESPEIDPKTLIDSKSVTCFIFKGEEYVQMPKEFYVQEKMELMQKLRKYENILKSFKENLVALDLS